MIEFEVKLFIELFPQLASAFWWFYISKILEFTDTIFFILRKKWSQLTFLHVYHHSSMFVICWIVIKWIPTGSSEFSNSYTLYTSKDLPLQPLCRL